MEFCTICDNMMYLESKSVGMMQKCKKCNTEKVMTTRQVVASVTFNQKAHYANFINPYTKHDPTLPRVAMQCPNCPNQEVLYIRYDNTSIKYVYLCNQCDHVWKIEK